MQINKRLMRLILEHVKDYCCPGDGIDNPEIDGYDDIEVGYHIMLCAEANYLKVQELSAMGNPYRYKIIHVTWKGHEFLQSTN